MNDNTTTSPTVNTNYHDYLNEQASAVWEERFQELHLFQQRHGHCRVPLNSGVLGKWVMHLREKYKRYLTEDRFRGQLTAERIERLNSLGFEWSLRPPTTPWEERFAQLQAFHQEHGHSRVKRTDSAFGEWVQKQRKLLRSGKLSQERLQLLQSIGFEERIVPTNKTWEESFELLLEFRQEHGHTNVPKPNKSMSGDEHSLSVWADRQRMYYHTCFLEKKVSCLTKKRVKQLESIGFDWGTHRVSQTQAWSRRFNELQHYRQQHGHCNVPTVYPENKALGRWVSEQRANFQKQKKGLKSSMTAKRQLALESIGFQWKKPKKIQSRAKPNKKPHPPIAVATASSVSSVETAAHEEDGKLPAVNVGVRIDGADALDSTRDVEEAAIGVEAASGDALLALPPSPADLLNVGKTASFLTEEEP